MIIRRVNIMACDFCEKDQDKVLLLISGGDDVHICDECVNKCVEIIEAKKKCN